MLEGVVLGDSPTARGSRLFTIEKCNLMIYNCIHTLQSVTVASELQ